MDYDYFIVHDDKVFLFDSSVSNPSKVLDIREMLEHEGYKQRGES